MIEITYEMRARRGPGVEVDGEGVMDETKGLGYLELRAAEHSNNEDTTKDGSSRLRLISR